MALLVAQLASACGGGGTEPNPNPTPAQDTAAPATRATPAGGSFTSRVAVALACDDGAGSGCAATYYTLDGSTPGTGSTQYREPFTLSATTTVRFFSVDTAGNTESPKSEQYTLTSAQDVAAPTTTATPAGGAYNSPRSVALVCADGAGSGCAATHYTLDGSVPTEASPRYAAPLAISATTTLRFFSVDTAGNVEGTRTERYVLDTDAPTVSASPRGGIFGASRTVTLACDDGNGAGCAAIHYTTDGSIPSEASARYTEPLALTATTRLRFLAVDRAGNASVPGSEQYTRDGEGPESSATPGTGTYATAQRVTLTCDDGQGSGCAAIHYTLDGTIPSRESPRYQSPLLISTTTVLHYLAVDAVDNLGWVHVQTYTIDTTAPTTTADPAGGPFSGEVRVTLACDDGLTGSGCAETRYTLNGTTPGDTSPLYTGPFSVTSSTTLRFFSVDGAGNREPVRSVSFTLDNVAPTTTPSVRGGNFTGPQAVTLSCVDGGGGDCDATRYTLDGTPPSTNSARYTGPLSITTTTTLRFFSVDTLGNAEAAKSETYVIDAAPPTTTATPAGGVYRAVQDVVLTCNDGTGTGCAGAIRYSTNPSAPTSSFLAYSGPIRISADTLLRFFSQDGVGNTEAVKSEEYRIDTTAPSVSATPPGGAYFTEQTVRLSCIDAGTGCAAIHYTLNGATPDTNAPRYEAPFTLSTNTTLAFIAVDTAGNRSPVVRETYTFSSDTLAPVSSISPPGGTYFGAQTVWLSCTDEAGGSGCAATYYTLDGSEPTTSSPVFSGPFTVSASTRVRYRSADVAGNLEAVQSASYTITTNAASAQIHEVRTSVDGPVSLVINGAVITYVKPGVGNLTNDPAGFFLQAEQAGPAVFVEADPAFLSPTPRAGMRVNVTVSNKRMASAMVRVNISSFNVQSSNISLTPLVQEVSTVDVPSEKSEYEAELLSLTGTVNGAFIAAGAGHVQAPLVTQGVPASSPSATTYRLRMVESVREQLDVTQGCTVGIRSPLWVFGATAQASVWTPEQVTSLVCPGPRVEGAQAAGQGTVIVRFDRRLNTGSVLGNGSQFTIAGLTVTGATVLTDREVWLSTSNQTPRQNYTVRVASTVRDAVGTGVDAAGNSGTFRGYAPPAVLRITELAPAIPGGTFGRDLVELYVVQGGNTNGMTLVEATLGNPVLATLPDVDVATGDVIVVHLTPDPTTPGFDAPGPELTSKTQYPQGLYTSNYDTAWDFHGVASVSNNNRVFRIRDALGNTQDAVPFVYTLFTSPPAAYLPHLQALQAEGQWLPADCNGALCTYTTFPSALDISANWTSAFPNGGRTTTVRRVFPGDSNTANDWAVGPASLGVNNP
jgi:hypothetical protein